MALLIGIILALAVGLFATAIGLDRERAFYSVVAMVVATYYVLFAVMGGSSHALIVESLICVGFVALAASGFKWSMWIVAAALAGHGMLDLVHSPAITNPGVPSWWPGFCMAYDVTAAVYLTALIKLRRIKAS